jgi:hypothetical protein
LPKRLLRAQTQACQHAGDEAVAAVPSEVVDRPSVDVIELEHGSVGSGTAISGLRPDVSASVELRGTAPLAKVELSILAGIGNGGGFAQMSPDGVATPNGEVTAVLGNVSARLGDVIAEPGVVVIVVVGIVAVGSTAVGSVGRLVFAKPFTGHGIMLLAAMPPTGAPRLSTTLPRPSPAVPIAGLVIPAGLDSVGAAAEPAGIPESRGATWAALVAHPSRSASAAAPSSCAVFRRRLRSDPRFIFD